MDNILYFLFHGFIFVHYFYMSSGKTDINHFLCVSETGVSSRCSEVPAAICSVPPLQHGWLEEREEGKEEN